MPAYGSEATIREAVESVLAQTMPDLELLIIDDASPTPMADALADVDDSRLGLFRHARNQDAAAARNTAIAFARAPLVSQLDPDDVWEPAYLTAVIPQFQATEIGLAYTNAYIIGHPEGLDDYIGDPSPHPLDRFPRLAAANPAPSPTVTMRTAAVRAIGGYNERLWGASDYDIYLRLAARGWRFAYIHRRLARYRWPGPHNKTTNHRRVERSLLRMWAEFVARHPFIPGPRRQLRTRAREEAKRLVDAGTLRPR